MSFVGSVTEIVYRRVSVDVSSGISQLIGKLVILGGCNKETYKIQENTYSY